MEPFASRLLSAVGPRAAEAALLAELERLAPSTLDALESAPGPLRVVVPSSSLRIHVLAEMARRRPAWLGVEVTTLRRIALSLFERAGAAPPRGGALLPVLVRRAALREPLLARPLAPLEGGFAPLVGTVTDRSEQLVLGASDLSMVAPVDWTQLEDPARNPVIWRRVDPGWDCARLAAERDTLFPPNPTIDW